MLLLACYSTVGKINKFSDMKKCCPGRDSNPKPLIYYIRKIFQKSSNREVSGSNPNWGNSGKLPFLPTVYSVAWSFFYWTEGYIILFILITYLYCNKGLLQRPPEASIKTKKFPKTFQSKVQMLHYWLLHFTTF